MLCLEVQGLGSCFCSNTWQCLTVVHCRRTMFTTHVQTMSFHSQGWALSGIIVIHVQNMIDHDDSWKMMATLSCLDLHGPGMLKPPFLLEKNVVLNWKNVQCMVLLFYNPLFYCTCILSSGQGNNIHVVLTGFTCCRTEWSSFSLGWYHGVGIHDFNPRNSALGIWYTWNLHSLWSYYSREIVL